MRIGHIRARELLIGPNREEKNMLITNDDVFKLCLPVLTKVKNHKAKTRAKRRFITAYQIWELMDFISKHELENKIGSKAVGKKGGDYEGPVKRIAMALGRHPLVDTEYIDTRRLLFSEKRNTRIYSPSSGEDCGLFRLKDSPAKNK